ncbi:MAG: tRNA lysidine(34) synthetase TilS [Acetanaerobacterium sp.]
MEDKALAAVRCYHMLDRGDRIVAGVSGGADSMALLHFLCALRAQYDLTLQVCHVNHGIRGEEAVRDERLVAGYCERHGVPCEVVHADVPALAQARGVSVEECGRMVRYEAFARIAAPMGAKIATAHTLSDSLETMLFHLARGTGLKGLCGIPPVRGNIIRPLIEVTRAEVEQYCHRYALPDYTRNRIRMGVVPALMAVHPAGEDAVLTTLRALREDEEFLSEQAEKAAKRSVCADGYDAVYLAEQPPALRARAIGCILKWHGIAVRGGFLEQLGRMLCEGTGSLTLSSDTRARVSEGALRILREDTPHIPNYNLPMYVGERVLFDDICAKVDIMCNFDENCSEKIHPNLLKNVLDYDNIRGTAYFRPRREGDRIRIARRGCTKTLKKLMNEAGIPAGQRALVPVLADEGGVIWAEGFGCAERVAVTPHTGRAVVIQIIRPQRADDKLR